MGKMGYKSMILLLLVFEVLFIEEAIGQKNVINIENGAYSNVLIAIDKKVPDNPVIENLQAMFTSASRRLYLASKQHVYWRQIKILVPNTWSSRSQYRSARTETLQSANIIVHEYPDDEPLVNNIAGCGKEGSLLHLTPRYVLDEQYREDKFGNTDNVLVRSWGYYRWGLFREHYTGNGDGFPAYDSPTSGTEGTRCSFKLKGSVKMPSGYPCQSDPHTGYKSECRFVPDTGGQTATGSLLFAPNGAHVPSVVKFCEDNNADPDSLHNPFAPNLMNKLCGGDSAWKVMTERTEDFQAGVQQSIDPTPEFEVLQASSSVTSGAIVFVLDISGSMAGSRFDRMIQACTAFINSVIPSDIKIGIVVFQSTAGIRAHLTDITNSASRRHVVNSLPSEAIGGTCIGCGILKGIEVLGEYARGGYILLLSDGGENNSPFIRDTYEDIEDSGVIIDTITISNSADGQMEYLSSSTSGISNFCSDSGTGTCLLQSFQSTLTTRPDITMETVPIQIYSSDIGIHVSNHGSDNIPIVVDSTVGSETVVTVFWTRSHILSVVFTGPDGNRIDRNHQRYHLEATKKIVTITLPEAKTGLWQLSISNGQFSDDASVSVTSKPNAQYSSVTMNVFLGSRAVNFAMTRALAIYAQVQQDYQSVSNANVTAIIRDSSKTTTVTLKDNGSGSDVIKDDGTYSGYFLNFRSNGRYNVKVNVFGSEVISQDTQTLRGRRSTETTAEPSFMRTVSAGVFKVEGYTPNAPDILPPSRIHDLVYTSFSFAHSTVTLSWTAVGDNLDQGTANIYELRYSTDYYKVRNNFSDCNEVTDDQVVFGNLSATPSGSNKTVTINLPERGSKIVYYFAIRAWDEAENSGEISNIASLSIRFVYEDPWAEDLAISISLAMIMFIGLGVAWMYFHYQTTHITRVSPESTSSTDRRLPDVEEGQQDRPCDDQPSTSYSR